MKKGNSTPRGEKDNSVPVEMSRFFDERVDGYDSHMKQCLAAHFDTFYAAVADAVEPTSSEIHLLDLGSGTGAELKGILLRAPHARITCVDVSNKMLAELGRKYAEFTGQIEIIQGSFLEVSFPEVYFDYVVSVYAMHDYAYQQKLSVYSKIRTWLSVGGKYIEGDYVVPTEEERTRPEGLREKHLAKDDSPNALFHIDIPFSVDAQKKILREAGLAQVDVVCRIERAAVLVAKKD